MFFRDKARALVRDAAVLEQPDHRGHTHGNARGVQEVSVLLFRHGDALEHKNQGAAGGANVDGFVGCIQDEHRRVQRVAVAIAMHGRRRKQAGRVPACWSYVGFDPA